MNSIRLASVAAGALMIAATGAQARDQVQIAGSSTVLPYAKIVAENFGETFPDFRPRSWNPVVPPPA